MKEIYYLKQIINIVVYTSAAIVGLTVLGLTYGTITQDFSNLKFTINDVKIEQMTTGLLFIMILTIIGYIFFIMSVFKLKIIVSLFEKRDFFSVESCKTLKQIGVFSLISSLLSSIPAYLYNLFNTSEVSIKLKTIMPDSLSFTIIVSLFFIVLSYIFEEASKIKEENELTI